MGDVHVACIHTHLISGASAVNLIPRPEDWTRLHMDRSQAPPSSLSLFFAGMLDGACERFSQDYLSSCMTSTPCFLFCPGLTQPVFFALLFQWHSVLSCLTLCFSFRLLCYLWGTLRVTLRTRLCHIYDPRSFTSWTSISTIPLRFTLGTWLWEIQVYFSNFSQRDYWYSTNTTYLQYDIRIHAYILTDTACVQHVNVGLAQARPNQYSTH